MKILIKLTAALFTIVLFASAINANAQTTTSNPTTFGIGLDLGTVTGNMHSFYNVELGVIAKLQYKTSDHLALIFSGGYYNFFGKNFIVNYSSPGFNETIAGKTKSLGIIPLKAGLKVFAGSGVYFSGEAGAGFETQSRLESDGAMHTDIKLILSPGLGYSNKNVDVGLRYENLSGQSNNYGLVALRVAFDIH